MIHVAFLLAILGHWEVTIPVDGLNDATSAAFEERVVAYFSTVRDDSGDPSAVSPGTLSLRTQGDLVTLRVDHKSAVRVSDLRNALKGSKFAVRPEAWFAYGRVALEWETERELSKEQILRIEALLSGFGSVATAEFDGTRFVEVVRDRARRGCVYHAHIRFKKNGQGPASKIELIVRASGIEVSNATLLWECGAHMPWGESSCGAKRK